MIKKLLFVSCVLLSGITTMLADEVTYYPELDVNFRTKSDTEWQTKNNAADVNNQTFECNYFKGFFVMQKYTVTDLVNATSLTLTLTAGSGVDATMVWLYPNNDWDTNVNAETVVNNLKTVIGFAPQASDGELKSPLASGQKVANSNPAQATLSITGDALANVKAAAVEGTFTLIITNDNFFVDSKRTFQSSNSANNEEYRPTLVAEIEVPAVQNQTTGVGYSSLNDAVSAVTDEATLVINEDIELTARVNVPANVTLNIVPANDGITIKRAESNKGNILILPGSGCTLNLGTADKQLIIDGQNVEATNTTIEASNGNVTITNVLFKNCTSTNEQGILCRKGNGNLTVEDCAFQDCTVPDGRGVIFCGLPGTVLKGNNTFTSCTGNIYLEGDRALKDDNTTHTTPIELIIEASRNAGTIVEGGKAESYKLIDNYKNRTLSQSDNNVVVEEATINYITIGETGYTTLASSDALDLDNLPQGVTVYYASAADNSTVTLTKATGAVEAGTGLIFAATAGKYGIPVATTTGSDITGNKLVGCTSKTTIKKGEASGKYVLVADNSDAVFASLGSDKDVTIPAGKAYMDLSGTAAMGAPMLTIVIGDGNDGTTGITEIESVNTDDDAVYNLNGQRVVLPARGLYIVNGKKVIIK